MKKGWKRNRRTRTEGVREGPICESFENSGGAVESASESLFCK